MSALNRLSVMVHVAGEEGTVITEREERIALNYLLNAKILQRDTKRFHLR